MTFIKRTTLPTEGREEIETLFKIQSHKHVNVKNLLVDINKALKEHVALQKLPKTDPNALRRIRKKWAALSKALTQIDPETRKMSEFPYSKGYPLPPPYDIDDTNRISISIPAGANGVAEVKRIDPKVLNQTKKTHLIRLDESGTNCITVGVDELLQRLRLACERTLTDLRPAKGRPPDPRRHFVFHLARIYRHHTGQEASSATGTAFPELVRLVLRHAADEETDGDRRKLIVTALRPRHRIPRFSL